MDGPTDPQAKDPFDATSPGMVSVIFGENHAGRGVPKQRQHPVPQDVAFSALINSRLATTGAHGIPNIMRASNLVRRLTWAVLFLCSVTIAMSQWQVLITKYFEYDVATNVNLVRKRETVFPAITLCNMNPIANPSAVPSLNDYLDSVGASATRPTGGGGGGGGGGGTGSGQSGSSAGSNGGRKVRPLENSHDLNTKYNQHLCLTTIKITISLFVVFSAPLIYLVF